MLLYHLDRFSALPQGKDIDLFPLDMIPQNYRNTEFFREFPDGLSSHGLNHIKTSCPYLQSKIIAGIDFLEAKSVFGQISNLNSSLMEQTLELVRRSQFPGSPSRFQSFFAVKELDEFKKWPELLDPTLYPKTQIFELSVPDSTPCFDANFLRGGLMCGVDPHKHETEKYYIGYLPIDCFNFAYKYWSGEASEDPRWEYLIRLPIPGVSVKVVNYFETEEKTYSQP